MANGFFTIRRTFWVGSAVLASVGLTVAAVALTGNGGTASFPVTGLVRNTDGTADQDLTGGVIVFETDDWKNSARGTIQGDGHFTLSTIDGTPGALPGEYHAVVLLKPNEDGSLKAIAANPQNAASKADATITIRPESNEVSLTIEKKTGGTQDEPVKH